MRVRCAVSFELRSCLWREGGRGGYSSLTQAPAALRVVECRAFRCSCEWGHHRSLEAASFETGTGWNLNAFLAALCRARS
eukprot:5861449-Prymnesium_polylepis.1